MNLDSPVELFPLFSETAREGAFNELPSAFGLESGTCKLSEPVRDGGSSPLPEGPTPNELELSPPIERDFGAELN